MVYTVRKKPSLAFKQYHVPTREREQKLEVMLKAPPTDPTVSSLGHPSIAWPLEIVDDAAGEFCGFVMPRILKGRSLAAVAHPRDRRRLGWRWTWRHLMRVAQNLSGAVASLHAAGYVIGDMNSQNVLVTEYALVTIIDCDSMQIRGANGRLHRCMVGTAEYTAPELISGLHGKKFRDIDRTVESDNFALAILIYQLLFEGTHPYQVQWKGQGDPPDRAARMRQGLFAHSANRRIAPPPGAPPFDVCPPQLRKLFRSAFMVGASRPEKRPTARAWREALAATDKELQSCEHNSNHVYANYRTRCPWCARIQATGVQDPFPDKKANVGAKKPPPAPQPAATVRTPTPRIGTLVPAIGPSPPRAFQLAMKAAHHARSVWAGILSIGQALGVVFAWLFVAMYYFLPVTILALNVFAWYLMINGRTVEMTDFAESSVSAIWQWDVHWAVRVPIVVIWAVLLLVAAIALIIEGLVALVVIGIVWLIGQIVEPIFSTVSVPDPGHLVNLLQPLPFR